jgi:uncharacterized protein YbjT (DUF2867 family)
LAFRGSQAIGGSRLRDTGRGHFTAGIHHVELRGVVMILVTGATGTLGREVVNQLLAAAAPVRVLVRTPAKVSHLPAHVQRVQADLEVEETLRPALTGVERAFLVAASTEQVERFLAAARAAGVEHVVLVSTIEAGSEPPLGPGVWHREREQLLAASGLGWTVLRPTLLTTNTAQWWAPGIQHEGVVRFPGGDSGRIAPVDPADVVAVAAATLRGDHDGRIYSLTGPAPLAVPAMVQTIGRILGRPLAYEHLPVDLAIAGMRRFGLPDAVLDALTQTLTALEEGRFDYATDDVETVTGERATDYRTWCTHNRQLFTASA